MDTLRFGALELKGSVMAARATVAGQTVPALELRVEGPVTAEMLAAMTQNDLVICGQDGSEQGRHSGYDTLTRHSLVLARPGAAEKDLAAARQELEEARQRQSALEEEKALLEQENAALLYASLTGEEL